MASVDERVWLLERRLEKLEFVLHNIIPAKLLCPTCGLLLTIHEEYKNVEYSGGSHAQCYRCGTAKAVKEPVDDPDGWKWLKGSIRLSGRGQHTRQRLFVP